MPHLRRKVDIELEETLNRLNEVWMYLAAIEGNLHYPEHWDLEEYPTIFDALISITDSYYCCNDKLF